MLYLAINRAIRTQVSTEGDVPFVVDADLSVLDMDLSSKVMEFIENMAGQIILLERCFDYDRLRLATYEIRHDAGSGKSMIVECQ